MNEASRLAPRPARVPQTRRDRDALRRERMAAPLDFRSTGPTRPRPRSQAHSQPRPRPATQAGTGTGTAARSANRRQALTAWGVLLMVTGPTAAAAALDALVTGDVHWFFDLVFVAASFHAATLVRRRDLLAGVIVPPLAYCAGLLTAVQFGVMRAGHGPVGQLASLGALLAVKPRPLFLGTALAAALIAARWAGMRSAAKR
ncbi:DUF6542 domain-containing protein [Catenulispora rubra]|uniref:DUF6542 domain-containing protein n=1 Tax=Catenulispora rubra TaxID=280293 RepID=UPI00189268C2|nr:DUF6542 domain-containing protein [Catenulispora rubra]